MSAAQAYRQLEVAEDSMRHLKSTLRLRPMFHRAGQRVEGHVGLCVLALFLLRLLETRLLEAGLCHTGPQALSCVNEVVATPLKLGERELWPAPHVGPTAAAIFRALDVPDARAQLKADLAALGLIPEA